MTTSVKTTNEVATTADVAVNAATNNAVEVANETTNAATGTVETATEVATETAGAVEPVVEAAHTLDYAQTDLGQFIGQFFSQNQAEYTIWINLAILAGIAAGAYLLTRLIISRLVQRFVKSDNSFARSTLGDSEVFKNLSKMLPWIIIQFGINMVPQMNATLLAVVRNVAAALAILYGMRVIVAFMDSVINYYTTKENPRLRSIKSYIQLGKIGVYIIGTIWLIAALIDRSPAILISGLGAMSAISMLVFKDTIMSFVAGLQISSNDMLRIGDWIEMPQVGADGNVIDIALHTVRIQNFDKTIVTVPTWRIISESYRNYRGMYDVNGRRIKRTLNIDITSIKFMTKDDLKRLSHINVLQDYLKDKITEIEKHNTKVKSNTDMSINRRRITNIGTFRAYATQYLKAHPMIRKDLSLMVRQQQPTAEGMPLEVYCFTDTTVWVDYEAIQGDLFDHLYSVLPEFGLRPFQQASGYDVIVSLLQTDPTDLDAKVEAKKELAAELLSR